MVAWVGPIQLSNPKQNARVRAQGWYRYYAGYAPEFVRDALRTVEQGGDPLHVLDPWVGAGTTSAIAVERGHTATGVDINPALVAIAKARMLGRDTVDSLEALTEDIIQGAIRNSLEGTSHEPLLKWFGPKAAASIRALERSIFRVLVAPSDSRSAIGFGLNHMSSLAAFYYVALFRATRSRLRSATTSNPAWVKASVPQRHRAKPSQKALHEAFRLASGSLATFLDPSTPAPERPGLRFDIQNGSSTSLNLADESVDLVITSPPYCTRIDYVASVRPELAILGCDDSTQKSLQHMTLGNPTVPTHGEASKRLSSRTARQFLGSVKKHPSKASTGYYHRYFETYFRMLESSLDEMQRVVRAGGTAFLVVQDSFYKEVHLDLPRVTAELASAHGWKPQHRVDFHVARTMAAINPRAREHRGEFRATESVLVLERT